MSTRSRAPPPDRQEDLAAELKRLRRENETLRQEREILEESRDFFAKDVDETEPHRLLAKKSRLFFDSAFLAVADTGAEPSAEPSDGGADLVLTALARQAP